MSRRIMAVLVGAVGFVAILLLAFFVNYQGSWLTGFSGIPGIQNSIADEAEDILVAGDVRGFELEVLGRYVTIDPPGDVPSGVVAQLLGISGVGDVRFERIGEFDGLDAAHRSGDDVGGDAPDDGGDDAASDADEPTSEPTATVAPTATPVPPGGIVEATYEPGAVAIAGQVHTAVARDALVQAAERLAGDGVVLDEIEVTDGPGTDADQIATIAAILRRLDEWFQKASLTLEGGDLAVTGEVFNAAGAERAEQVIGQLADRIGLQVGFDATVIGADDDGGGDDAGDGDAGDVAAGDVAAVVADLDLSGVVFEPGSPVLDEGAFAVLDDVAARLADLPAVEIEVQGHTAGDGDPDVNLLLSDERAQAVRDYLISQGVDPARLTARGYGAAQPVDETTDGQADDERIELVVVEEDN